MEKLKSRKLILTIVLIAGMMGLNAYGSVTGDQLVDFIKWALGIYVAGNAASKFGKGG